MAVQLVRDMTGKWNPADYADKFTDAIHALAAQRVKAGKTEKVTPLEDAAAVSAGGNVVDLTELLKKSLSTRKAGGERRARAPAVSRRGEEGAAKKARRPRSARRALRRPRRSAPPEARRERREPRLPAPPAPGSRSGQRFGAGARRGRIR